MLIAYKKICDLAGREAEYFEALVGYDQAKDDPERIRHFDTIVRLSPNLETIKLENEAYRYFSKWYYPVVLSVLDILKNERDHKKIAFFCKPRISAVSARNAIKALTELGFVSWDEGGNRWRLVSVSFSNAPMQRA